MPHYINENDVTNKRDIQDGFALHDQRPADFTWATQHPKGYQTWGLAATAPAISDTHIDGAGFCTWLQIELGTKTWLVGHPREKAAEDMTYLNKSGWRNEQLMWEIVQLEEGDEL